MIVIPEIKKRATMVALSNIQFKLKVSGGFFHRLGDFRAGFVKPLSDGTLRFGGNLGEFFRPGAELVAERRIQCRLLADQIGNRLRLDARLGMRQGAIQVVARDRELIAREVVESLPVVLLRGERSEE